ncbi:hypothetical protein SAMN04487988_10917 [Algoriphagus hitonicola]|uniref:Uncharacterized protein n=2 Tax=Algoriphagus hitonicola TaxID=435880 RepID=A0A1I2V8P1_9BACT|nr:hypothetical protein [Algoriphagus hitonicola]SFG84557.1 hypothetical protein SAMN04487988_10917 [Algoriphagus hitonicola]
MTEDIKQEQKEFLKEQLWSSTIGAATSRAGNIYKVGTTGEDKKSFKKALHEFVTEMIQNHYEATTLDEPTHLKNIKELKEYTTRFGFVNFRFGHAQKVLNLYLKYLWCLGLVQEPPHFPVDRLIQQKMKIKNPTNWTKNMEEDDYIKVIEEARILATRENFKSIAALELSFYNNL